MFNPLSFLYSWVNRTEKTKLLVKDEKTDFNRVSPQLDKVFCLDPIKMSGRMQPVGKAHDNGFEFKLNKLNYYMIVPKVEVTQTNNQIVITRYFDKKSRHMQYYWISIFAIVIIGFTLATFNAGEEKDISDVIIFGFLNLNFVCALIFFWILRKNIWKRSLDKALELLEVAGIKITKIR